MDQLFNIDLKKISSSQKEVFDRKKSRIIFKKGLPNKRDEN